MNNSDLFLNNNHNISYPNTIPPFPIPPLQQGSHSQRTIQVVPPGNSLGSLPIDSHALLFGTLPQAGLPSSIGSNSVQEIPPLPLLMNPLPSQQIRAFENNPSNSQSSTPLNIITFGGISLRDLMNQLRLCHFEIPSSLGCWSKSQIEFTNFDGFEYSIGYFPFKIEAINFKDNGRPIQIIPANEKARLVFHVFLRHLKISCRDTIYFTELTFSLTYMPEKVEKAKAAGYDLNSLTMLNLDSFDWENQTGLREKFYSFILGLTFSNNVKGWIEFAESLSKGLFNEEIEFLAYAFHYLQIRHKGVWIHYPSVINYNLISKKYEYYNDGPLLAIFLTKLAFSPDYKKIFENVFPLNKWGVDFNTYSNPERSFRLSFEQLVQYMIKTGKDVFPMTPAIAEEILSYKGPLTTNLQEKELKLPIAAPSNPNPIPIVTRTTSAVASVIPAPGPIAKTEVASLDLLLKENPALKAEAEKMFTFLADSVCAFLEKELSIYNIFPVTGSWRFENPHLTGVLKNVLNTFLKDHSANKTLASTVVQHFLNYFFPQGYSKSITIAQWSITIAQWNEYLRKLASSQATLSLFHIERDLKTQIIRRIGINYNKIWSFSFTQLIHYITKTGKDVFPITRETAEQILSFQVPLPTNLSEQQSTLPVAMSAEIPDVTRTTSGVTSVIPSTVTIAKTEVRSLDLLLKENPDLKVEAEKMFRLLVDSVFLEKELIASNLVHAKGTWRFTLDPTLSGVLKNVLTTFLKGQPAHKTLALSVIQHFLNYFPLRASTLLFPDLFDPDKDKIVELLNQYGRMLASPVSLFPMENDLRTQIIPILMRIKMLELKKIPLIQQMDIETKGSQIPCFLISAGIQQSQVSFLMAHFGNHGLLEGFSIDRENIGKNLLVGKGLMEANLEEPINNQGALNTANLEKLKILFKNKSGKQRLPEFLVLEPPSLPNPVSQEQKVGSKRKKDAIDLVKEIEPKKKKVRILPPIPLNETTKVKDVQLKSSSSSSDQMEIDEGDFKPVTDSLPDSTGEISWENLWHEMGRRVLEKLSSKSQDRSKQSLRSLSLSPLELPIVDLIHVARYRQMNFVPLNHLLKPYQAESVKKLLISLEAGLSPLLALEMGTGKSWVINEMIAHLIGQGREGTILIVLPLSVVSQMAKENQNYLAIVSATAWIAKKAALPPKDLTEFQKHIVEDIKIALVKEEIHQVMTFLPLLALFDGAQLYDSLCNSLPSHQNQFWNKLSNILESQLPLLLGTEGEQIVNEARAKASQLVLSKEKAAQAGWKTYFDTELLKNLLPGNSIEGATFMPPLLFAQLRFAGTLMWEVLSKVQATMPKHYVTPLVRYLSRNTVQCNKKEELTQALKEEKKVIITSYDAFQDTPQETFERVKVAGLVFDEAQKLHTSDTTVSETCLAHIRHLKESHPKLPVILSTATPFENRLSELWTLLQLANPSEKILPNFTFERITKLIEEAQNFLHTMAKSETKEYPDKVIQAFVTSFAAAEAFRNALSFLVERKKRNDPSVIKDWGGVGPERKDEPPIKVNVTPLVEAKLSAALADFKKNRSHFIYSHKVNRILLHPDLAEGSLNNKNPATKALLGSLKSENAIKEFLKGSPRLSTMLTEPNFVEMITQGEKGLILSEYVAEAEITRLAILSQYPGKVEVRLFTGGLSLEERDRILEWYKAPSVGMSKVLILMKKAGGVGLNLPEAVKIFRTSDNWNPSVDAQAEDRANRVNKAGRRVFVSMNFDNYHDAHLRSVREVKKAIEAFFHQKNDVDIMTQFRQFCTLLLEQCYQSVLNEQKELISANEKRKAMEAVLVDLIDSITENELALAVAACQPKLKYSPSLKLAQAGILPISYKCSYDDAVKQAYLAEKKPDWTIGVLKRIHNPLWREELRQGNFSPDNSQEKMAIWNELKSLESQPLTELSLSEIKATHTIVIYGGAQDGQGYQLQKIENPGLPSTLCLYRRQGAKGPHYDILNVLA